MGRSQAQTVLLLIFTVTGYNAPMRITALITLVALLGCHNEPPATQPQITELEGKWSIVSYVWDGKTKPITVDVSMRFAGNTRQVWSVDSSINIRRFSLDPSAMPAEIDIEPEDVGIYELDGDTLTICIGPTGTRPDRFESTKGS